MVPRMLSCTFIRPKVALSVTYTTPSTPYLSGRERGKVDCQAHGAQQPGIELSAGRAHRDFWRHDGRGTDDSGICCGPRVPA